MNELAGKHSSHGSSYFSKFYICTFVKNEDLTDKYLWELDFMLIFFF